MLLNPDLSIAEVTELYDLADADAGDRFGDIADFAERLIDAYVGSPPKRIAAATVEEFFRHLDLAARMLAEKGELNRPGQTDGASSHSVALVPRGLYAPIEWCKVLNNAGIPPGLARAVEACRRRNELVRTVLEYMFGVMLRVDVDQALRWQLGFLEARRGRLDPDVVRDLINSWMTCKSLPREPLAWAETWSDDDGLNQQWPQVVRCADRLLCRHGLLAWQRGADPRNSALAHLRLLVRTDRTEDGTLLRWLRSALMDVGESILRFFSLSRLDDEPEGETQQAWRSGGIVREILRLESLFVPVMLTSDLVLGVPDGANQFAVAFFGLIGKGREQWEVRLTQLAEDAVRRAFLTGLRDGVAPSTIIRRLTFGDPQAYEKAMAELDILSMNFDSIKQREKVVRFLAVYYASYHGNTLLANEVSRRYRTLMRLMHEDHLRRVLVPEHFRDVMQRQILTDLAAVASDARRYLTRRRALESSLEELVAAEMEFLQSIRRRRLRLIHTLLGRTPPPVPSGAPVAPAVPALR